MAEDVASLTLELLREFRGEMAGFRSEMAEFRKDVDARFEQVDRRFEQVDHQFEQVNAQLQEFRERFTRLDQEVTYGFQQVQLRLDGHSNFAIDKLRDLDERVTSLEERARIRRKAH